MLYKWANKRMKFRDEFRDRYGLDMLNSSSTCDGCNSKFTISYGFSGKVGGLVHSRYDERRDALGRLASAGFQPSNVGDEPIINLCRDMAALDSSSKLIESSVSLIAELISDRGDLLIQGFWECDTDCIINVRMCDVN